MCLRNAALLFSLGVVGHWVTTVLNVLRGDWLGFIQPHHIHCVYNTVSHEEHVMLKRHHYHHPHHRGDSGSY